MDLRKKISEKFNKSKFELLDCNNSDSDWSCIDSYIVDFIKELNNNENISTIFSCEGHKEGDFPYLFFNVNEIGWDLFWQEVLPELSYSFSDIGEGANNTHYGLIWTMNLNDNNYSSGISIHTELNDSNFMTWQEKKMIFWNIMKNVFLKYYK